MTEQSYKIDRLRLGEDIGAGLVQPVRPIKLTVIKPQLRLASLYQDEVGATNQMVVAQYIIEVCDQPNFDPVRTFMFCTDAAGNYLLFDGREFTQHDIWIRLVQTPAGTPGAGETFTFWLYAMQYA